MIIQRLIVIDPMVKWLDKFSLGIDIYVKFSKIVIPKNNVFSW